MSDQIDRQYWFRKNVVSERDVVALVNQVQGTLKRGDTPKLTGAVVFAFGNGHFNFVTNQKDARTLLQYGDPVGVVGIGGDIELKPKPVFATFKGHEWAKKHTKKIIKQAQVIVNAYVLA
jgi:hypothetical protein